MIKTTPKDFFLQLGATVVLYASVIALINLAFSVINYYIPDELAGYFSVNSIVWPISMLIVLVPLLYTLEYLVGKDVNAYPEKREFWLRRWRIYLTLFLSGATIVVDFIALVNTYLNGELTGRFFFKILAVLIIAGIVFTFYMLEKSNTPEKAKNLKKIITYSGAVIVLIVIVLGFGVVGSPKNQRLTRFDQQKVNDLQNIQWQVLNYFQTKGELPTDLVTLRDPLSYNNVPVDPQSKAEYGYENVASTTFKLCADFNLPSKDLRNRGEFGKSYMMDYPSSPGVIGEAWDHEAGRKCFERRIDPVRYPVFKEKI